MKQMIYMFTDGACKGNPGPGGYGTVIVEADHVEELGDFAPNTTNNEMELAAVLYGLKHLSQKAGPITILSDSKYVIQGLESWVFGWIKKNWQTANGQPVKHQKLWLELHQLLEARRKSWPTILKHLPAHVGIPGNERADTIASEFAISNQPSLHNCSRSDYPIADINSLIPTQAPAAEKKKKKKQSGKPLAYLSMVAKEVRIHKTWTECELRVKGQKGALFKKYFSEQEKQDIIADWNSR